jgi:hypothetical protein
MAKLLEKEVKEVREDSGKLIKIPGEKKELNFV